MISIDMEKFQKERISHYHVILFGIYPRDLKDISEVLAKIHDRSPQIYLMLLKEFREKYYFPVKELKNETNKF